MRWSERSEVHRIHPPERSSAMRSDAERTEVLPTERERQKDILNPPWGEVPERSEGGGEVKEWESGRATAGSDKRPRLNNTHEQASYGQLGGRRREIAHTAQITPGSA